MSIIACLDIKRLLHVENFEYIPGLATKSLNNNRLSECFGYAKSSKTDFSWWE